MKTKQLIIYETAEDVVNAMTGNLKSEVTPPDGTYLVFENNMEYCHISGYESNYDGNNFLIHDDIDAADIIEEMANKLNFRIHIT